jgi:hypothetical protein
MSDLIPDNRVISALDALARASARSLTSFVEVWYSAAKGERPSTRIKTMAALALELINDMPEPARLDTLPRNFAKEFSGAEFYGKRRQRLAERIHTLSAIANEPDPTGRRAYTRLSTLEKAYALLNPDDRSIKKLAEVMGRHHQSVVKLRDKHRKAHGIPHRVRHYETTPWVPGRPTHYEDAADARRRYAEIVAANPRLPDPRVAAIGAYKL